MRIPQVSFGRLVYRPCCKDLEQRLKPDVKETLNEAAEKLEKEKNRNLVVLNSHRIVSASSDVTETSELKDPGTYWYVGLVNTDTNKTKEEIQNFLENECK